MLDFDLKEIENSDRGPNHEIDEKFNTNTTDRIDENDQIDMTDMKLEANEIEEESNKNGEDLTVNKTNKTDNSDISRQKQLLRGLHRFFTVFNECFTFPRTYILAHVNINTDLISRDDSEKRVFWLLSFIAFLLSIIIGISILSLSFMKFSLKTQMIMPDHELKGLPVVQKLVVVFGDGTTLMLAMNKSFEFNIIQYHKFNYDKNGFFAFDQIDHIQTLVGSQGKLNLIHDYWFNSKKVPGKSLYVV